MAGPMLSGSAASARQGGFTYIGLLIMVALIAAGATASLGAGASLQRRDVEGELLAIGLEFRAALQSYADASPIGQPTAPRELAELLRDPRYPGVRRHLRRVYPDPLTGAAHWGLLRSPDGRIAGIHSLSGAPVIRQANFPPGLEGFEKARWHSDWVFAMAPVPPPKARGAP